ncbi:unnamed protein product [Closterium sp. NIES-65]|nr:unnamed protein product [Closterium sp. NIES-65]
MSGDESSDLLVSLSPSLAPHYPSRSDKNKAVDPCTTFPTIDIAFLSPDNTTSATSHFYLKLHEYLAQPHFTLKSAREHEPGLLGKYLFIDQTNGIGGWMDAPNCGAEPLLPPPSPPPPSPVTKRATQSLSPLPAALSAALALATSAVLLALRRL